MIVRAAKDDGEKLQFELAASCRGIVMASLKSCKLTPFCQLEYISHDIVNWVWHLICASLVNQQILYEQNVVVPKSLI